MSVTRHKQHEAPPTRPSPDALEGIIKKCFEEHNVERGVALVQVTTYGEVKHTSWERREEARTTIRSSATEVRYHAHERQASPEKIEEYVARAVGKLAILYRDGSHTRSEEYNMRGDTSAKERIGTVPAQRSDSDTARQSIDNCEPGGMMAPPHPEPTVDATLETNDIVKAIKLAKEEAGKRPCYLIAVETGDSKRDEQIIRAIGERVLKEYPLAVAA